MKRLRRAARSGRRRRWSPSAKGATLFVVALGALALLTPSSVRAQPIVLDHDVTLQEQFGYDPEYPLNVPAFDRDGRAVFRERGEDQHASSGIVTFSDDAWRERGFLDAVRDVVPDFQQVVNGGGFETDRVVCTRAGTLYTALTVAVEHGRRRHVLLRSTDDGQTWTGARVPHRSAPAPPSTLDAGDLAIEHFTGHNEATGPPFMMVWRRAARPATRWSQRCHLYVTRPTVRRGELRIPKPVRVTSRAMATCQAAGGASQAVTVGRKTFFVYLTMPRKGKDRYRSPVCVAVYDARTRRVTGRRRIGFARPGWDFHCAPGICVDARGYLHVVIGSHNGRFKYARSRKKRSIASWTRPRAVLDAGYRVKGTDEDGTGRQTYVSLVCDDRNTLHLVSRQWRAGVDDRFGGRPYGALIHQSRRPRRPWSQPDLIVVPPTTAYVNYYQKLSVDRRGRLFLSLSCWQGSESLEMRAAMSRTRYRRRMVLCSEDGASWRFATTADLVEGDQPL